MRLIDADALLENQPKGCYRTSDWINNAPTIDAIPVEWLEKKCENLILTAMVHSTVYGDNSIELCHAVNVVLWCWICGRRNRGRDSVNLTDSYACGVFTDNRHNADS